MIEFPSLEKTLEEISKLKTAHELLFNVWLDVGPYKDRKVSEETWDKVRNYFKFDDSE